MAAMAVAEGKARAPSASVRFLAFSYRGEDGYFDTPLPPGHYRNPVLAGFHPDPSLCRVGDDYYLVTSSFACFPGLPVMHSRDLVNWRLIGHAVNRPGLLNYEGLGISRGLFAPALTHHDGRFYLCCTMVGAGGNFLLTARNAAGPWSEPQWLPFEGIDPSLFIAEDGRVWIVNNGAPDGPPAYDGHRAIWIQAFDLQRRELVGPRRVLVDGGVDIRQRPVWIEGPHLFQRKGWTYLCAAEGGTSVNHSQVIFRSRSLEGPFEARFEPWSGNPILTQRGLDDRVPGAVSCAGHAQLFIGPDQQWWASFLACRPDAQGRWHTGRETFLLPVRWTDDDWPVILPPGQRVPGIVASPRGVSVAAGEPSSGNFRLDERFGAEPLSPHWLGLRGPHQAWAHSDAQGLWLQPRDERLSGRGTPAFLARRVAHGRFEVSVLLEAPAGAGVSAGLALFQSEAQHVYAALQRQDGELRLRVERCDRGETAALAGVSLGQPAGSQSPLWLRLSCDGQRISTAMRRSETEAWLTLPESLDASRLSVQAAGGGLHFTGLLMGVHARSEASDA